jgi:hypothetical protein
MELKKFFALINKKYQFIIFLQVSVGSSEKKGGYPTNISKRITPRDHQSTVSVYPLFVKT